MDESWRMRMGMHVRSPPRPTARTPPPSDFARRTPLSENLDPDDFSDVFGGPPRTVLLRKFSGDFAPSDPASSFYDEVFRPPEFASPAKKSGRSLPAFRIPAAAAELFYGDVFGSDGDRRSRERSRPGSKVMSGSKSKSNSSSALSSEELSPLRPMIGDDVGLSSFASKLRPINVPCRWNSIATAPGDHLKKQGIPAFPYSQPSWPEERLTEQEHKSNSRCSYNGFARTLPSPESVTEEPSSRHQMKIPVEDDDMEINSPSSVISSLCQDPEGNNLSIRDGVHVVREREIEDQDEDEISGSFVIEIGASNRRDGSGEALGIDEAIAWAKEKFRAPGNGKDRWSVTELQNQNSPETEERSKASEFLDTSRHSKMQCLEEEQDEQKREDGSAQSENDEMELLDQNLREWSAGKETNIQLVLSTLHQILWPNSGWSSVPLTSLIESSQVKKAYQRATLCLHPDKLQQKGATVRQKYVAQKAFSILQEAWGVFISQNAVFS
ncbi:uncharacterized protein LOC115757285 isoform X2 [Rhodamnia argentea]|uniref:Uncharacterized protein LOC115757285 isoform X2 n=1 Tax=Rhodamnia argentea TaxID=178133 RepID=A0ABM3HWA7_9MYRT|nr:uncharacterized protein LOC115757285 isoform X2 [Rhodamnia argentea]